MIISKALQRFIASGGKIQKLKPQKFKRQSGTSRSSQIADQNIRDTLGPDPLEFGTVRHESARILRQESIGRRWAERKFVKDLPQELKKGRIVIAKKLKSFDPIKKSAYKPIKSPTSTDIKFQSYPKKFRTSIDLKKAKSTSAFKRYKSVEKASDKIFTDITEKRSPFKHQTTDIKFIKSKRFKKGLPKGATERTMGWAPKDELTKGQKIAWAKRPENIYDVVRKDKKGNIWGINKVLVRGKKDPTTGIEYGARWKEVKIKKLKK